MVSKGKPNPQGEPVPNEKVGSAVTEGQLRIDGDRFELDLSDSEAAVVTKAVEWDSEVPAALSECLDGFTFRGDYPALKMVVGALRRFEEQEACIGQDKIAYDARTAFNHSRLAVKEKLEDGKTN